MMRRFLVVLFVQWSAALFLGIAEGRGADTNEFLARIYTNASGHSIPYRLLLPRKYDPSRKYPVLLYLHGAAGRGIDNLKPLDWGPMLFLEPGVRERHNFFLVVPQCPRGESWTSGLLTVKESEPLQLAIELVSGTLSKEFALDP